MRLLDLTLSTPEANLALDEALLNGAESNHSCANTLRLWESPQPLVVVGRASKLHQEVNLEACRTDQIPVLRRCSGGTAVVAGPGCLMYAVILGYQQGAAIRTVDEAHRFVMQRMQAALRQLSPDVHFRGSCDLTLGDDKISGNSLRCKRRYLLYHGTVLYDFPIDRIARWLGVPPRQPTYRNARSHQSFLANFAFEASAIRAAICDQWQIRSTLDDWPREETDRLVVEQYARESWNKRL